MSRLHKPIKTKCYHCKEPTKREVSYDSAFYIDDGILFGCDNEKCPRWKENKEAEDQIEWAIEYVKNKRKENREGI